jgi:hypothetical protein
MPAGFRIETLSRRVNRQPERFFRVDKERFGPMDRLVRGVESFLLLSRFADYKKYNGICFYEAGRGRQTPFF